MVLTALNKASNYSHWLVEIKPTHRYKSEGF